MTEKISYYDWFDFQNLWELEIKKFTLEQSKEDLDILKSALKNNIIAELNYVMPEIHKIFIEKNILSEEKWNLYIDIWELSESDFNILINYKQHIFSIFENQIKENNIFSENEKESIFKDINSIYTIILEIENEVKLYSKKSK